MKRRFCFFVAVLLFLSFAVLSLYGFYFSKHLKQKPLPFIKDATRYELEGEFFPEKRVFSGKEIVYYKNNEKDPLKELFFHVYPNAFSAEETAPFTADEMSLAYPEGFSKGGITIKKVAEDNTPLIFKVEGTLLNVSLKRELKPGDEIKLSIEFEVLLPKSPGRFGYYKRTYNFGNWYPILCVYDEKGWHKDPYYKIGDPFYSDIAFYKFILYAPPDYKIASTGRIIEKKEENHRTKWVIESGPVRDFAFILSREFEMLKGNVGETEVISYYFKDDRESGAKALEIGKKAIKYFSEIFGPYIYDTYSVVAADFYMGGMEYPNLVLIDRNLYKNKDNLLLEYVVVHETAHQWWYGIVGNDEVNEPWLDEALAEYSTVNYFEKYYGKRQGTEIYENFILNPYKFYELSRKTGPILRPLNEFIDWKEYDAAVYKKGAIMLKELEKRISKQKFINVLKNYYKQNQLKNATTEDFIKAVNGTSGTDFRGLIYQMLKEEGELKQAA
ncbi:MAG: M1 family metallopeptidase [Thermovenabulum sp.]|uniref:M1 family metallopeptidase n=1 Tax=Thermovenabulum sp. TaxID=3100335 RepID=UPI003C7E4288